MDKTPTDPTTTKSKLDKLSAQEEKILRLLRDEQRLVKERFPLAYAVVATVGVAATFSGINKLINRVEYFDQNPLVLIILGLAILVITGAAYKKLG